MATTRGNLFAPELVSDLISKVKGKSSLAVLSGQEPIPFNGMKEMTFSFDNEVDIVAEAGAKSEGGITLSPVTIIPIKFEYGARISDEFMYASEEEQIDILSAFNDGFAKKLAKGFDTAAFHGLNPRTGAASAVVGSNCFDSVVNQDVTYAAATVDDKIEAAIALVQGSEGDVTGMALSTEVGSALAQIKANGISQYPEFKFGANPGSLGGMPVDVNKTVKGTSTTSGDKNAQAYIGDFANAFKWGYSKEIPMEIIQYGDPDNSGNDLKGHNQIYLRAEAYLGWGILVPSYFARLTETVA